MAANIAEKFGIDVPIFAFSHCRDVVVEVTRAGGMGVLGAAWMTTEELEQSLRWIDDHVDGKPYGVDVVFPGTFADVDGTEDYTALLPAPQVRFVKEMLARAGVAALPDDQIAEFLHETAAKMAMTPQKSERCLEVCLNHPVKFIVGAMGVPPKHVIDMVHARGIPIGALVGNVKHAIKQRDAGVDVVIAQGAEAGGHTGNISSLVLWPQIVDAVAPMPVLAAGGIGRGRQIAAAMATGAAGVWMGSVWLGTTESELTPEMRQQLFAASSEDAVISYSMSGKRNRMLRSKYTEAWEQPDAPDTLTFPLQSILSGEPFKRAERAKRLEYWTYSVGQIVGEMKHETTVRQLFADLLNEYLEGVDMAGSLMPSESNS